MTDEELDAALDRARQQWRVPPDPPLDAMWSVVCDATFRAASRPPGWTTVGIAAAAALIVGAAGGRYWMARGDTAARVVAAAPARGTPARSVSDRADQTAMGDLLGRTDALLTDLPVDSTGRPLDPHITREGGRLLTRTRLLLDSPLAADPRMHNLLQDLELVLAQVARLEPQHPHADIRFIRTALDEHDLVPRLRSAAADLSHADF